MGEQFPCEAAVIRNHALTRSRPNWSFTVSIDHGKAAASGSMTPGGTVCTLDMQIKTFPGLMNTFIDCDICVESTPLFLPSDRASFNIGLLQSLKQY